MSIHEFCDHCPGCRPAMINIETGQVMPQDSDVMIAVNRIWDHETTYAERKAFIAVTLHNSRRFDDMQLAGRVMQKIQAADPAAR
jgi:hypothetical protein